MTQIIAGLGAQLGLDTTEFKKGISEAKISLKEFAEYLPEALSVAAFVEMTKASMEMSNQIVESAKANDIAISSVLELSKALEENGGSAEDTGKIYSGFTQKIESAALGNQRVQDSFYKLGVTLDDLRHLSEQDLFAKTIDGLANMKDSAERNGLAFQVLGKSIRGVDIKGLADSLDEGKGKMDKYAYAVEQAHELSMKLKESSHQIQLEFTNAIMPSLNVLYDSLFKTSNLLSTMFEGLKTVATWVAAAFLALKQDVMQVVHALEMAALVTNDLLTLSFSKATEHFKQGIQDILGDANEYAEAIKKLQVANDELQKPKSKQPDIARQVTPGNEKALENARGLADAYKKQAEANLLILTSKEDVNRATKNEKELETELMKVVEERNKALAAIDVKISAVDKTKQGSKDLIAILKDQEKQIDQTYGEFLKKTQEAVLANQKYQQSFEAGWKQAFDQYQENSYNAAQAGKDSFNAVTNSMTNALNTFIQTGKINFKNFSLSIIQDLLAIQIKMQIMQASSGMFKGMGSFFGIGGSSGSPAPVRDLSVPAFAMGGDPPVGQASLVGENGPELFIPKSAGTVIPNNVLGNMGGNSSPSIHYNGPYIASMQAIDTQSATQFLARNKSAVWAANQSAQRGLPQSK